VLIGAAAFIGYRAGIEQSPKDDDAWIRSELTSSFLQQPSASDRIKAISLTYTIGSDTAIGAVLIGALQSDPSVNVRLAALNALTRFTWSRAVTDSMVAALPKEPSPVVQIALVDLLLVIRDPRMRGPLSRMLEDPRLNPAVRKRLQNAVDTLHA